jgi:CRP-like cAMP-binding protein
MGCGSAKSAKPDEQSSGGDNKAAEQGNAAAGGGDNKQFLTKVELFKRLPPEELPNLANKMESVTIEPGTTIIKQGDLGNEFFVIKTGSAKVVVNEENVATLKGGDYFGEQALLRDDPRNASIIAQTTIEALKITRDKFVSLGLNEKLEFAKRGAVGAGASDAKVKPPDLKTQKEIELITAALKNNANLTTMITLDDAKTKAMIDLMWKEDVAKGKEIITEGDDNADYFYVVNSGAFEATKEVPDNSSADKHVGRSQSVGTLAAETSFGELALLYYAPRAATITATADAVVFVLARQQFKTILESAAKDASKQYIELLGQVPGKIFDPLKDAEKKQLAEALNDFYFEKDEIIFQQGEKGQLFYILIAGEVQVATDGKEVAKLKGDSKSPQFFGETALLNDAPRGATIKVVSNSATCLAVDKASFDMLLGPLEALQRRGKEGTNAVEKAVGAAKNDRKFGVIFRKDLKRLGLLGCGGFGAVEMVEHTTTQDVYALKALSKGYVLKTGMQKSVMSEKDVQLLCDSVFVVQLYETYNGEQSLYLLLELALGGELYATYNKKGLWGNEKCAKFYVAGTVFAFDHLHSKKIIFRDLKPENLLLNEKGQVKLTDMGLAKVVVGKTFTTCGTPDYFAPELIASKGHTEAVDWWTLGILNFELLGGHPPFESASPMQIYQKVTKGINKVQFPKACKGSVEALIKGNCHANPAERLPMKKGGTDNVKKHAWYQGFSWTDMEKLTMDAPYKPPIKNKKDMANFSARKEDMPPQVPYKDPGTGWDKDFATSK